MFKLPVELPNKSRKFFFYTILDGIGSVLAGVGLTAHFADLHFIPESWRFENYPFVLIGIGILLIIPFVALMVKTILARLNI